MSLHENVRHDVVFHNQVTSDGLLFTLNIDWFGSVVGARVAHGSVSGFGEVFRNSSVRVEDEEVIEVMAGIVKLDFPFAFCLELLGFAFSKPALDGFRGS